VLATALPWASTTEKCVVCGPSPCSILCMLLTVQRAEPRRVIAEKLDRLRRRRVRHAVVGFVAVREPGIQAAMRSALDVLGVLDVRRGILLPERDRTEQVLGVRHVSNDLAELRTASVGLKL